MDGAAAPAGMAAGAGLMLAKVASWFRRAGERCRVFAWRSVPRGAAATPCGGRRLPGSDVQGVCGVGITMVPVTFAAPSAADRAAQRTRQVWMLIVFWARSAKGAAHSMRHCWLSD